MSYEYAVLSIINVCLALGLLAAGLASFKYPALRAKLVPMLAVVWALMALFGYLRGYYLWKMLVP